MELHHRGSKRYITPPSCRSNASQNVTPILEVLEMLFVISSEKTLQLYYLQAKQLAEILGYEIIWKKRRDD